jgi:short-subunit dehydrogenase
MKFFEGCMALITGASSGLGEEFAHQLAPVAKALVLVARRNDRLEALRERLLTEYPTCSVVTYQADLSQETEREQLANWLKEQQFPINFLINNAGLGDSGEFSTAEWPRVRSMLDVNIAALTHLTYLLLPSMLQTRGAAVLNISSVAGFFPLPNMAVYSATKAYVTSFSEALAMELRPKGIIVTALCPGPIPTEFFEVATRPNEEFRTPHSHSMPAFVATPRQVVFSGLQAVVAERPRTIPNPLLALAIGVALMIPFCLTRKVISCFRTSL